MKKRFFLLLYSVLFISAVQAQNQQRVHVNFGDTLNNVLSMGFQYLYPEFTRGSVHFSSNEMSTAYLNYNILMNEIHFVELRTLQGKEFNTERDFLQHAMSLEMDDVSFVVIGRDHFINTSRGVMYLVANYEIKLLRKDEIKMSDKTATGAYGASTQSAATEARRSLPGEFASSAEFHSHGDLKAQGVAEFSRSTDFFLYDDGRLRRANQRGFERAFRSIRDEIRSFVKEQQIDFQKEQDLAKLLQFCNENS